jgi:hypothetical protein
MSHYRFAATLIQLLNRREPVGIGGGGKRDRTADLLHAMQALSQLSYTPIVFTCVICTAGRQTGTETKFHQQHCCVTSNAHKELGGVDGTRTRDPRRDRPVF